MANFYGKYAGIFGGGGGGSGDVVGPGSSTDNAVARFDGTTGKLLQNSVVIVDDSGNITGVNRIQAVGNGTTPAFWVDTGGGASGFYFGSGGTTFTYNTAEVFSFISSIFKTNVQLQLFLNTDVNTPGIFFLSENATGFYRIAANNWGFTASGTKILDIGASGLGVTGALTSSGTATLANIIDSGLTASTVPYADASKQLTSSAVTPTELGYVSGVTSSIQTQLNGKQATLTIGNLTDAGTDGIVVTGGTGAVIGSGTSIAQHVADSTHNGYLSSADWSTFNSKGSGTVTAVSVATANGLAGSSSGGATPALTLSTTITGVLSGNGTAISAASTTGSGAVVLATTPTLSSPVVGTQSQGDASTKAASTAYVDTAVSNAISGVDPAIAVQAATTAAGNTSGLTYSNGVSGVGATFTGAVNTALTVDGYTFTAIGQRLLVKNDTQSPSGAFNGIYYVTQIQTAILPIILTRALDYNTPSNINNTGAIPVVNGTVNATTSWLLTSSVTTVGTDPLTYTQFSIKPSTILTNTLTSAHLFVGNGSNVATDVAASGDLTLANTGAFTVAKIQSTTVSGTTGTTNVVFSTSPTITTPTIAKLANLTSNGYIRTSGGDGTLNVDSAATTYVTLYETVATTSGDLVYGGASGTPTRLAKGSDGQVLTLASGVPSWAAASAASVNSYIYVGTGNGYGGSTSGETQVRNFATNFGSNGSDITYTARTTTAGDKFTINTAGVYAVTYTDLTTASNMGIGITVNCSQLSTAISSITYAQGARGFANAGSSQPLYARTFYFAVNDVIRAMTDNLTTTVLVGYTTFSITRIT